ncbi:MAG: hypothetical protein KDB14_15030 [Planctomycetales bacterium]|nr:hypothetical protein [Planctomycetales bacterium]
MRRNNDAANGLSPGAALLLVVSCLVGSGAAQQPTATGAAPVAPVVREAEIQRRPATLLVTRSLGHERLLPFLKEARPDIAQIGNYGAMFHGYADHPKSTGWPMQLPVSGERAALDFQRQLNAQAHQLDMKVVGHFRLIKVMGNWEQRDGFVEYYNQRWPTELLGPRPHEDVRELLQRDADGVPIQLGRYNQSQLALCLSSPYAVTALKRMLKVAVDHDVDGVITAFNYHFGCACPHCQRSFKQWLRPRVSAEELRDQLGIEDLERHRFVTLPARIPGYPEGEASHLEWLACRWAAEHFKRRFDEIFLEYGRSLKPDLLVAQWNHLGHVGAAEERALLPLKQWGAGEDYFWYSGGASFVGDNLSLERRKAGDAWLSCLYVRELSGDKPFVMGKYDRIRMAASMAEGFATGGLGMGRYMRFEDPAGYETLARYIQFRSNHRGLYDHAERQGAIALLLPRQSVMNGSVESLDLFRELGQQLLERPELLDVVVDERMTLQRLKEFPVVMAPGARDLSDAQVEMLRSYVRDGGKLLAAEEFGTRDEHGAERPSAAEIQGMARLTGAATSENSWSELAGHLEGVERPTVQAPWTVRGALYRQKSARAGQEGGATTWLVHLVNYNRDEQAASQLPRQQRGGPDAELPLPVANVRVRLPRRGLGAGAVTVRAHSPDWKQPRSTTFQFHGDVLECTLPEFNVYCVLEISLRDARPTP